MTYDVENPDNDIYHERDRLQRELDELRAKHEACAGREVSYHVPDQAPLDRELAEAAMANANDEPSWDEEDQALATDNDMYNEVERLRIENYALRAELKHTLGAGTQEASNAIVNDVMHLRKQTRLLQGRCSELLAQRRGIRYLVHEFHDKFGYPVRMTPEMPSDDDVRFRLRLIAEEFFEVLGDALAPDHRLDLARSFVKKAIDGEEGGVAGAEVRVNFVSFADNLGDLDYVVEGTRLTFGIDGWPILLEIQRANMDKSNEALAAADSAKAAGTVKAQKPPGWKPPDIEGELRKQGYSG